MTAAAGQRLRTLDAVRGIAVMGIFLLNVVSMTMPAYAYIDPHYYGGATGVNWWEWAITYVIADGKFRGLFTMMFGASTVLIAQRAQAGGERPAVVHYARMATLLLFGMLHAYLIWAGDILVLYAICGAVAFVAWRWRPRVLLALGVALLVFKLANGMMAYQELSHRQAAAMQPGADAKAVAAWQEFTSVASPPPGMLANELKAYRGSFGDALTMRVPFAMMLQTVVLLDAAPDTIALILIGMALFQLGFFSGAWSRRTYWLIAAPIPLLLLAYVPLVAWLARTANAPLTQIAVDSLQLTLLRPFLSLGYAALIILFVQSGRAAWLADRIAATGRMAFSNYLGTSIVVTSVFNGYGLGWYGHIERWQCLIVVAVIWALMLGWSKPWLDRFAYGPFEWLWRSAARFKWQPFRRRASFANASQ